MKLPERVTICEVGTRDGFQIEPEFIPTELKVEVVDMWHFLISATIAAGMSPVELVQVYEQKWRVNHARQDRGDHGRATKEQADAECRTIRTGL